MLRKHALLVVVALVAAVLAGPGSAAPPHGVTVSGSQLLLDGQDHYFAGINAYDATSDWHVNNTCGPTIDDLDTLFSKLPRGSLVRTWAFQALGFNKYTKQIDFSAIDRVVQAAAARGDYLLLTLSEQAGVCDDGHWHDKSWYDGGYLHTYNDSGLGYALTMNYLDWVKTVVTRYRADPTVAVYEPVNEPEAANCSTGYTGHACYGHTTCPVGATDSLRKFFDTVGSAIKHIEPSALVAMGTVGGNECGVAGTGFDTIAQSPGVDIATYHDYSAATTTLSRQLSARLSEMQSRQKPLVVEESGINAASSGGSCISLDDHASAFEAKSGAAKQAGADGYLPWNWWPTSSSECSLTVGPGDPALNALKHF